MKKLKLESLEVTSFETTVEAVEARGTVHAAQRPVPVVSFLGPCFPTDANFDCTYGCSLRESCPGECFLLTTFECEPIG